MDPILMLNIDRIHGMNRIEICESKKILIILYILSK